MPCRDDEHGGPLCPCFATCVRTPIWVQVAAAAGARHGAYSGEKVRIAHYCAMLLSSTTAGAAGEPVCKAPKSSILMPPFLPGF